MRNTIDSFYVLYVLSTGLIDDVKNIQKVMAENEQWKGLPLQVMIISLAHRGIATEDQDTVGLQQECNRLNLIAGWSQFNVVFYDRIKRKYRQA
jgi:hypothetical protein